MKFILSCIILIISIHFFASCKSVSYTPETYEESQLIFGEGGGFTGKEKQYCLLENGQLYEQFAFEERNEELKKIKKKQVREIFVQLDSLDIASKFIHQPGNRYFYIEVKEQEMTKRITWGKSDYKINSDIEEFYKKLKLIIQQKEL